MRHGKVKQNYIFTSRSFRLLAKARIRTPEATPAGDSFMMIDTIDGVKPEGGYTVGPVADFFVDRDVRGVTHILKIVIAHQKAAAKTRQGTLNQEKRGQASMHQETFSLFMVPVPLQKPLSRKRRWPIF